MKRADFEHVIAVAAQITGETEIVVIGSQAVLAVESPIPEAMLRSIEADIYPLRTPSKAIEIDAQIGDNSRFHALHGYYAHGVGPETAKAPSGWEQRLVAVEIPLRVASMQQATALCLEIHDVVLAKCVRGDQRDWDFAHEAFAHGLVDRSTIFGRIELLPVSPDHQTSIRKHLAALTR